MSDNGSGAASDVVPVFFLSDSTGISAETMGNALLIQFPDVLFERTLIPFISSIEEARDVVARLDAVLDSSPRTPLVFATAASDEVRLELLKTRCEVIDFFGLHMERVESILDVHGEHAAAASCTASVTSSATTAGCRRWSTPSSTTTARACAAWRRPT